MGYFSDKKNGLCISCTETYFQNCNTCNSVKCLSCSKPYFFWFSHKYMYKIFFGMFIRVSLVIFKKTIMKKMVIIVLMYVLNLKVKLNLIV